MPKSILLGDEAVALAAVHAGLTAAYAYPGTPSTEIMEALQAYREQHGGPHATWCANEKTAFESALGTSFAGRRALVSMKHVGLNVAADPFMNAALVEVHGGLVLAVADDPGMHSSQNEQDSRCYADFARIVCLEPATQQEAYDMTVEAYELSERFRIPVMLRLVTRLAHSRTVVETGPAREPNPIRRAPQRQSWILLPGNARRQWRSLLQRQSEFAAWSEGSRWNALTLNPDDRSLGVITCGIARGYFRENAGELKVAPSHLHIGVYPPPVEAIRKLAAHVGRVVVLEDGYPVIERALRGLLPGALTVNGRMDGVLPPDGELTPENVRAALGLPARELIEVPGGAALPNRPPQLCSGCAHGTMYSVLQRATEGLEAQMVTADIGCYTLGALPPYSAIESCVCMGASIGMAKGASDAGYRPVVAVIGDSTFLHSGITPMLDAVAEDTDMTVLILDNEATAMTGGQQPLLPTSRLHEIVLGLGVDPEHCHLVDASPKQLKPNAALLRREIEHPGLSVMIAVRECVQTAKRKRRSAEVTA
jgi:indolepyruvate ferredoxin oxidoreductase, alpha subunit